MIQTFSMLFMTSTSEGCAKCVHCVTCLSVLSYHGPDKHSSGTAYQLTCDQQRINLPHLCSAAMSPSPRDVLQGLDYLHTNHVMHGDLKPDNLLLSAGGTVKISDFGSCMVVSEPGGTVSMTLGTPAFMAPEMCQLRSQPYKPFAAEMWALGVCLYIFIYGTGM